MKLEFQVNTEPFMKELRLEALSMGKRRAKTEIRKLANYLKRALHNAPSRAKRQSKTSAASRPNSHYREGQDLRIFFPDPDGGIHDSGMTVSQFLQHIKGGYRATGAGSFLKEKVQTRARGGYPPGTYAERNQRPGEFFRKGTGRFSQKERERLAKIRERRRRLEADLKRRERKTASKELANLRKLEAETEDALFLGERKQRALQKRLATKRQAMIARRNQRNADRKRRLAAFDEKNRRYRIVIPSSRGGYTDKPRAKPLFRIGGTPGSVPKTWSGGGLREYFISRNWKVEQVSDLEVNLALRAQPKGTYNDPTDDAHLFELERGGSMKVQHFLIGYIVYFRDESSNGRKFSHRRVSIMALYSDSPSLKSLQVPRQVRRIQPHPFVAPTIKQVRQKFH